MPDKSEKERRKQIMGDLKKKADQEFEISLPMSRDGFQKLFDYLESELGNANCDDTHSLTNFFLLQSKIENVNQVLDNVLES